MASSSIKTRYFGAFRGVDYSSDQSEVADYRLAECENMYKDYHSGQGQAIETIPGFRLINDFGAKIYGIHVYQKGDEKTLIVHAGKNLYKTNVWKDPVEITKIPIYKPISEGGGGFDSFYDIMAERKSTSFAFNNRIYILDGKNYIYYSDEDTEKAHRAIDNAYIPLTHRSLRPYDSEFEETKSSGEYSQRNILNGKYKASYVADGKKAIFALPLDSDVESHLLSDEIIFEEEVGSDLVSYTKPKYDENIQVYQYGIRLPAARKLQADEQYAVPVYPVYGDPNDPSKVTEVIPYPNAVKYVVQGKVFLVNAPPLPEENNKYLDENGMPITDSSARKPEGFAGIEIIAPKKITTINGVTLQNKNVESIIEGCTIATVHDGKVFMSGNPEYPNYIFYSEKNKETGYEDPSYFGINNYFTEGVTNTPITALMPIADTLMVLRKDTVQDGSVTYRTRLETNQDLTPVVYTGSGGLPGVGCLGASCSFLDDPVFVSKYGIEAMGQLSARYERAIEHRSSLIDGLLLNKNLENASIAEFDGYMWVLIEGEIFLADSRQRYTHSSGVMNYEWFYLKDIGVYDEQNLQAVYADLAGEYAENYKFTRDEIGDNTEYNLVTIEKLRELNYDVKGEIGDAVLLGEDQYIMYYNEPKKPPICFIKYNPNYAVAVKYAEYFGGGKFDKAMLIKTVDHDKLMFGTDGGKLCCFNFDKRDPEDNYKIPNEFYTFNGRIIKSALATKMDNCGVLNYVKNTVKKSMVIKMRTFEKSGTRVWVITNRQTGHEVERLIGGKWNDTMADFAVDELSLEPGEKSIFRVREKEKKWLEKQLILKSEEFKEPFALHYIAYDFVVAGRYKD